MSLRREHALEMGGNPDKDPPFFFTKPPDAAVDVSPAGAVVHFPPETQDLQHEVEMVVAIGRGVSGPEYMCSGGGTAVTSGRGRAVDHC